MIMEDRIAEYLHEIDLAVAYERVKRLYEIAAVFCPEDILDVFISDYTSEETGRRNYESLWFFSERYVMEAKEFIDESKDDVDIAPIGRIINYLQIIKEEFDLSSATESSKLYVFFRTNEGITGRMKAEKKNCVKLIGILNGFIKPNIFTLDS